MPLQRRVLCFAIAWSVCGQTFDAASVKPAAGSGRSLMRGGPESSDAGRIAYTNVTLMSVLLRAWDAKPYQAAGPEWLSAERYDIAATIPAGATKEQFETMLQRLLADRFHMKSHRETRRLAGYELVAGKGARKLRVSTESGPDVIPGEAPATDADGFPQLTAPGLVMMEGLQGNAAVSFLTARAQPISALAEVLSREFRMPVVDRTGMAGRYDFRVEFAPQAPGALPPESSDDAAPNLISAIPRQLGLRLNARKIAVEEVVVDSADKVPSEN
jgi:uncharacterized protein (TIGR03435 family)